MNKEKMTIEKLAEMSQREFSEIRKTMATGFVDVRGDLKLVLSAIENLSGQIADVKASLPSALDFARLEGRVDGIEKKLGISPTSS
ncbi:MAG: hypothetical protein ACRERE_09415 [Candidatus Entotheonellia bacterium]